MDVLRKVVVLRHVVAGRQSDGRRRRGSEERTIRMEERDRSLESSDQRVANAKSFDLDAAS
jgi:hypothetical protein